MGGVIKGVCALRFSPDGSKLACVCIDDNHMVVVFDVEKKSMIACEKGDTAKIVDIDWVSETEFVTVGIKHFKTWTLSGQSLKDKKGSFGKYNNSLICVKRFKNNLLCGSTTGDLQVWGVGSCTKSIQICTGTLDAVHITPSGKVIVGGKNGVVVILDEGLKKIGEIPLKLHLMNANSLGIRALSTN